jgi:glycosyltransferase involved in cell wall biosynthesis
MIKIIQLVDSLHAGGAERMAVNITNVLHENGYEVILCSTRTGGPLEKFINPDVRYYVLNKKHFADITAFRKLLHIIKHNNVELIHAHSSSLFWAVAAKLFLKNIKVIWHDHLGLKSNDRKTKLFYKIASYRVDGIIAVNEELFLWARKNMKVPAERVFMINNFPLLKNVHRQPDPDRITIVCLANLRPQKAQSTLIKAVGILAAEKCRKSSG